MNTKSLQAHFRGWFPQEPPLPKHLKIKLESHKRDWFPKDPLIAAIKTTDDEKFNRWALCPFLTPGALMILSAILSTLFGLLLVFAYLLLYNRRPKRHHLYSPLSGDFKRWRLHLRILIRYPIIGKQKHRKSGSLHSCGIFFWYCYTNASTFT